MSLVTWGTNSRGGCGMGFKGSDRPSPVTACMAPRAIRQISPLYYGFNALDSEGNLWQWGGNENGEIDGTHQEHLHPIITLTEVTQFACGGAHTLAIRKDGSVWTRGGNDFGQNGILELAPLKAGEEGRSVLEWTQIPGLTEVNAVAASGSMSVCKKRDGSVWVFGENKAGNLGLGNTHPIIAVPTRVPGVTAKHIACGGISTLGGHILVVTVDDRLLAAGKNNQGQLGDGTTVNKPALTPVLGAPAGITQVSAAVDHSLIVAEGQVFGFGSNEYGQLGVPSVGERAVTPTPIMQADGARAGFRYSLFRQGTSALACGSNFYKTLGDGTAEDKPEPVKLPLTGVTALVAGEFGSGALCDPVPSPTLVVGPGPEPGTLTVSWWVTPQEESSERWRLRSRLAGKQEGVFEEFGTAEYVPAAAREAVVKAPEAGVACEVELQTHAFKAQVAVGTAA